MTEIEYTKQNENQPIVHTVVWTVPNYCETMKDKEMLEIRTNKCDKVSEPTFLIKMQFLGYNKDIIELSYLYPAAAFLQATLTARTRRSVNHSIVTQVYHGIEANKWQYLTTLFKQNILQSNESFILEDGSLCLKFQFHVKIDTKPQRSSNVPKLRNDLESLLKEGLFSDVVMKSCDGIAFNVHKAVLASRSVVLKAHFEHNTTEYQTNIIECALEAEVLKEVLNFIYSDKTDKLDEIPDRLFAAADYYQLTRLKSLCEEVLHQKLTVDNAIETLHLADLHSASNLKKLTLEFIKNCQAKLITKTSGWANLTSVELIKAIYE